MFVGCLDSIDESRLGHLQDGRKQAEEAAVYVQIGGDDRSVIQMACMHPQSAVQLNGSSPDCGRQHWIYIDSVPQCSPADFGLPSLLMGEEPTPGQFQRSFVAGTSFPTLTVDRIRLYTDAYFSTFNAVYPILDERLLAAGCAATILYGADVQSLVREHCRSPPGHEHH